MSIRLCTAPVQLPSSMASRKASAFRRVQLHRVIAVYGVLPRIGLVTLHATVLLNHDCMVNTVVSICLSGFVKVVFEVI